MTASCRHLRSLVGGLERFMVHPLPETSWQHPPRANTNPYWWTPVSIPLVQVFNSGIPLQGPSTALWNTEKEDGIRSTCSAKTAWPPTCGKNVMSSDDERRCSHSRSLALTTSQAAPDWLSRCLPPSLVTVYTAHYVCLLRPYHKEGQPGDQASVPPKCKLERIVQVKWKRGSDCTRTEENLFALCAYASELNWLLLMRWLNNITHSTNMNLGKPREMGKDRAAWCAAVQGVAESSTTESLDSNNVFICHGCANTQILLTTKSYSAFR